MTHVIDDRHQIVIIFWFPSQGELGQGGGRGAVGVRPEEDPKERPDRGFIRPSGESRGYCIPHYGRSHVPFDPFSMLGISTARRLSAPKKSGVGKI